MAERASRDVSGAKESSIISEGSADKDKDIDNSHSNKSSEDKELLSDPSVGTISAPQTSPQGAKDSGGNREKTYFTDRGYLDRIAPIRLERRRIEREIAKGYKPGEYNSGT